MDMISKSKLIHGTIAATMALSMTILPIAPASAEETVSAPESDYTGWVTQDGEYYWLIPALWRVQKRSMIQAAMLGIGSMPMEQWHTTKTCISLPEINGSGMTGMAIWSKAKITDTAVGITSTNQPAQCPKA